jgi:hypothetical protein
MINLRETKITMLMRGKIIKQKKQVVRGERSKPPTTCPTPACGRGKRMVTYLTLDVHRFLSVLKQTQYPY